MNNGFLGFPELREGSGLLGFPTAVLPANFHGFPRPRNAAAGTLAGEILRDAVFYIDALDHQRSGAHPNIIRNLGIAGDVLDARSGSTAGADSNDPKFLSYEGKPHIYLPGTSTDTISAPDEAALDITGDIDLRAQIAPDDWTPAAKQTIFGKWTGSGFSYVFFLNTSGTLSIVWTTDNVGANQITATSTANLSALPNGSIKWVRVTLDVDNGAAGNTAKFYSSDDGSTWTQLGADVTQAGVTSLYVGTAILMIGASSWTYDLATMKFYRAQVYNGIAGTKVLDIDTSVITSGAATSFLALTGQTVSINRATTNARRSVAVVAPCWLLGVDDFIDLPYSPALNFFAQDSFTVFAAFRIWNTIQSYGSIVANRPSSAAYGWSLQSESTALRPLFIINDNVNPSVFPYPNIASSNGALNTWSGIRDRFTRRIQTTLNGTSFAPGSVSSPNGNLRDNTVGSLANNSKVRIGTYTDGIGNQNFELVACAIYRRALSAEEIATLNAYFQARNP